MVQTVDLGGGTTGTVKKLAIATFTATREAEEFVSQRHSVFNSRETRFARKTATTTTNSMGNITVSIQKHGEVPALDFMRFKIALRTALDCLGQCPDYGFSQETIHIYVDSGAGSAGYVVKDTTMGPRRCAVFFGSDVWKSPPTPRTEILANYLYVTYSSMAENTRLLKRNTTASGGER